MSSHKSDVGVARKKVKVIFKGLGGQFPSNEARPPSAADSKDERERIAARAYALYQERGHRHGGDLQDWLDAEREIVSRQRLD